MQVGGVNGKEKRGVDYGGEIEYDKVLKCCKVGVTGIDNDKAIDVKEQNVCAIAERRAFQSNTTTCGVQSKLLT